MEENQIDAPQNVDSDSPPETKENNLEEIPGTPAEAVKDPSSNTDEENKKEEEEEVQNAEELQNEESQDSTGKQDKQDTPDEHDNPGGDGVQDSIIIEDNNETSIVAPLVEETEEDPNVEDAPVIPVLDSALTPPPAGDVIDEEDQTRLTEDGQVVDKNQVSDGEMRESDDEDSIVYDREQLLHQYKEALEERSRIQSLNQQYQHKLAEYFKKKKTDERGQEIEKNVTDQEQRYLKYMSNLEELQSVESRQAANLETQLEELKERCQEKQNNVEDISTSFIKFKYDTAKDSISTRTGKPLPAKDLEQYQLAEQKKENEVIAVRLENIKLKNRLKKREQQLKAKEELAEGLHLIDFEQLKIENQTYNEKIEERNEELLKLRKKINSTVQVLTHLKEKLQHVQGENGEQRSSLRDIEVTVAHKRDQLTRLKQARDSLRFDNNKLKHKAGLLGNKPLLRDFEERKDESEELRDRLTNLKEHHMELNINLTTIRKKITSAKSMDM